MVIRLAESHVGKIVKRGYPKGSVLVPQLWKVVIDELIRALSGIDQFSDDVVGIIEVNSQNELGIRSGEIFEVVER